ncbi:MAG: hypothetical protein IPG93_20575 [Burkholderiales bacterium]|nr:hypothetical protein [Burkholderiales bacterium]
MKKLLANLFEAVSMFVVLIASILILVSIYNAFDEKVIRPYQRSEKAKEVAAEKETVNVDASNSAQLLVEARKRCKLIGYEDVAICSGLDGQLPEEKQSIGAAKEAISRRKAFFAKCTKHYDEAYCMELMIRAYGIALRMNSQRP